MGTFAGVFTGAPSPPRSLREVPEAVRGSREVTSDLRGAGGTMVRERNVRAGPRFPGRDGWEGPKWRRPAPGER